MASRARFVIAPPGGGRKTEISADRNGTWRVQEFEYDDIGKRTKTDEKRGASAQLVSELLQQDAEFFMLLRELAGELR